MLETRVEASADENLGPGVCGCSVGMTLLPYRVRQSVFSVSVVRLHADHAEVYQYKAGRRGRLGISGMLLL